MPQSQEKRSARRVQVNLTAHCRIGTRFLKDPVGDLSRGGLYLKTREPVKPGVPVRVALALPHAEGPRFCTLVGSVARLDRDPRGRLLGVGVSFSSEQIAAPDLDTLMGYLGKVA